MLYDPKLAVSPLLDVLGKAPVKSADGDSFFQTSPSAKWSPPCVASRVPGDMRLLGGSVTAARGLQEISAEARVLLWLEQSGLNGNYRPRQAARHHPQLPGSSGQVSGRG